MIFVFIFLSMLSIAPDFADGGYRGGHYGGWGRGGGSGWGDNWIIPALIGGAMVYNLSQPQPVYVHSTAIYAT